MVVAELGGSARGYWQSGVWWARVVVVVAAVVAVKLRPVDWVKVLQWLQEEDCSLLLMSSAASHHYSRRLCRRPLVALLRSRSKGSIYRMGATESTTMDRSLLASPVVLMARLSGWLPNASLDLV